jgi:hypothetical protein
VEPKGHSDMRARGVFTGIDTTENQNERVKKSKTRANSCTKERKNKSIDMSIDLHTACSGWGWWCVASLFLKNKRAPAAPKCHKVR